jgi:two-component system phosphate regulon sensor histidine kinase PhoR
VTISVVGLVLLVVAAALLTGILLGQRRSVRAGPSRLGALESASSMPMPAIAADRISVEALADPTLIVAGDKVVAANAEARRLFGDRVAGSDLRLTVRHPAVLDALAEVRDTGMTIEREIAALGSGSSSNSAWRLRAVDTGDGRILVIFNDITQARLTERMRVDFVANASHELRTPLATLTGFIETLQGPAAEDEPARRRFLGIMEHEAARMSRLIDDLLSLSRIELDKHVRPVLRLDLQGLIADVGKTLAMRLEADQRALVIEMPDALPPVIADRDQILQVLHNLVSNALKYGRSGTPISVSAVAEPATAGVPATVRLTVTDVGDGIAPEHLPRLTERFYRVDSARSRQMGGTGLGLAIVKHIVERHRGKLEIASHHGQGTRVSFILPQAVPEAAATAGVAA